MKEDERLEQEKTADTESKPVETSSADEVPAQENSEADEATETVPEENYDSHFNKIYSNVASNGYENLRTSYIENKAKELRKKRK